MAETKAPETFETEDEVLPEGLVVLEEKRAKPAETSTDVVSTKINAAKAMARYQGYELDPSAVDFSGRLSGRGGAYGYIARSEYEIRAAGEDETVEQRFNRLQSEVKGLLEELEKSKAAATPDADPVTPAALVSEVAFLQQQLQQAKLDNALGPDAADVRASSSIQQDLNKRLLAEIGGAGGLAASGAAPPAVASDAKPGDAVTYELYYKPEAAKFAQLAKLGDLDARLAKVESSVGTDSLAPVAVELEKPDITLNAAVNLLTRRVVALSTENLNDVERRVQHLLHQADTLKKKATEAAAAAAPASEHATKVEEMYNLAKRWDATADAVPDLVERLQTLKGLHERGADFGRTLTELEAAQSQLGESLRLQDGVLKTLEGSFAKNMATIEGNFSAINTRMEELLKKMSQLK